MKQHPDEKRLIDQMSHGDIEAFERLFNRYFQTLHNIAYNRLQSAEVADDLVQDVFADLWKSRSTLEIHTSFRAYLYQAVKHKVFHYIRHQSVRKKEEYIERIRDEYYTSNAFPDTEEVIETEELRSLISTYLNQLPEKTQNIFYLSREEHCTYIEIAEKLDCSPKTVEYHIGKTLKHLRISLKDYMIILIFFCLSLLRNIL